MCVYIPAMSVDIDILPHRLKQNFLDVLVFSIRPNKPKLRRKRPLNADGPGLCSLAADLAQDGGGVEVHLLYFYY